MKNLLTLTTVAIASAMLLCATEVQAATRTVTNLNDSGPGSLRDTIAAANAGDEINFAVSGTIFLTSGQLTINKNLTITGQGADRTKIQRSQVSTAPHFRIFFISNGTNNGPDVNISGVTLAGGRLTDTFGDGACIYNDASDLQLTDCVLRDNTASNNGGAIYNDGAADGRDSRVRLLRCALTVNHAAQAGGAVYNNGANGGFASFDSDNTTFYQNTAGVTGAALYSVSINRGDTIASNRNATFVNEPGASDSRPLFEANGIRSLMQFSNSIISLPGATSTFIARNDAQIRTNGHNVGRLKDRAFLNRTEDQVTDTHPLDPAGLQPNGAAVPTIAVVIGAALDRGKASGIGGPTDARGKPRVTDLPSFPNAAGGDGSDVGAYEADDLLQDGIVVTVTSGLDEDDGTCGVGHCTLREAVARMNALQKVTPANQQLKIRLTEVSGTIALNKELVVDSRVHIEGPGARILALSAAPAAPRFDARIFTITNQAAVVVTGLTLRDGFVSGPNGSGSNGVGGAIRNEGTLTLEDCRLMNNRARGSSISTAGGRGGDGFGGAIQNFSNLTVNRCSFTNNSALGGEGGSRGGLLGSGGNGGAAFGGAISNLGTLALNNCTIAGNTAAGGAGATGPDGGDGGKAVAGIYNAGHMVLTGLTVTGNSATGGAGGTGGKGRAGATGAAVGGMSAGGTATSTIRNTIIAANDGASVRDSEGAFTSEGYNLIGIGDFSSGFNATGDQVGTSAAPLDPKLGQLGNNLGPTDTIALLAGSPAFDAGKSFGLTTDGRGFARTVDRAAANAAGGDGTDIGAFEAEQELESPPVTRLANISTRLRVETGDNVLIGGFIVTGSGDKRIIVRALGPSLPVGDRLANPRLDLFDGNGQLIASNDNWQEAPNRQEIIDSTIAPTNDLESAILTNVSAGPHTAVVSGVNGGTGVGLVEVYDLGSNQNTRLANISTRGRVLTGDNVMIGGLIVTGPTPQNVIIRAIGPSLPIGGRLADPFLELIDGNGTAIRSNNNWRDTQQSEIEASTIPPSSDLESAIVTSLPPAAYTAVVRGVNGGTGVALVELYALQ
jgi:CSLREA domain-containing protein